VQQDPASAQAFCGGDALTEKTERSRFTFGLPQLRQTV